MQEKYFIFEELYNANPMVLHRFVDLPFVNGFFDELGVEGRISKAIISYKKEKNKIYLLSEEFDNVAKPIVDIFVKEPEKGLELNNTIIDTALSLITKNSKYYSKLNSKSLSDKELKEIWLEMERGYAELFKFTWVHNSLDFKDGLFTTYLFELLKKHIEKNNIKLNVNEAFVILTTPYNKNTYFVHLENELKEFKADLHDANIVNIQDIKKHPELKPKLESIKQKFCWLGFGFDGPAWNEEHFLKEALCIEMSDDSSSNEEERRKILEILGFNKEQKLLFELSRKIIEGTEFRKEAMFNYYYTLDRLFDHISETANTSKASLRYVYPDEIKDLESVLPNLSSRIALHFDFETSQGRNIITGKDAEEFLSSVDIAGREKTNENQLKGQTSYPGRVTGVVKIVNEKADVPKIEKGNILVSIATNPELISAMKKSAALVTDRGGITCHAAIMSRELKIPCVVGTKIATQVLKDGDEVEVDADKGVVTILSK